MLLIRHSSRANSAVRTTCVAGELFVASVVICMILASFGDAVDPAVLSEIGLEFAIFDFGGELSVLAMRQWHLLQFLLAGAAGAFGVFVLRVFAAGLIRILRPAGRRAIHKVPIGL
jgi:hypothetical protein